MNAFGGFFDDNARAHTCRVRRVETQKCVDDDLAVKDYKAPLLFSSSVNCYQSVIKGNESKGALEKRYGTVLGKITAKFKTLTEEANVTKVEIEKRMELEAISIIRAQLYA
eukprot:7442610-Ditylum_brightwellii.AAC.1